MKIIFWAIISIALFIAGIRYVERNSIYFPMREVVMTPASAGLPYEDVWFTASDGKRLNGWYIPAGGGYTVLFCHGNAGNIGHRMHKISILHSLGLDQFVFDYRGYGRSEGAPSEQGLYRDAQAAYDYLTKEKHIPAGSIILYGESIGCAVIIELALKNEARALITEEAFTSVKDMARLAFPFIPHQIFSSRFDSVSKIKGISCPKLIIHSVEDEIVPYALGEKLYEAAGVPKKFLKLNGSHNTAFLDSEKEYRDGIKSFLAGL